MTYNQFYDLKYIAGFIGIFETKLRHYLVGLQFLAIANKKKS